MTITNIVINNLNDDFSQILSRIKLVKEYNLQCNNLKEILEEKEKSDELIKKTLEEHKIIIENYLNNLEETFNIDDLNELLNILFEKNNIIKKKINNNTLVIKNLESSLNESKNELDLIRETILLKFKNQSFIKQNACRICYEELDIPVDIECFDCRIINSNTGRPLCEGILCLLCARKITGFDTDNMIIKCPTCRIERVKPRHVNLAYKINMPLLRALDAAILEEEESFNKIFKYDLNLIECQLCKMRFKTISELQHHIIGDNIVPACSEIKIICIRCRISKPRRMIFNLICNDCDNLIIN